MAANLLVAIAPVKVSEEGALRELLEKIGDDIQGNPFVRFTETQSLHFARWAILHDVDHGYRLLFYSNYDGALDDYLKELIASSPGLDQIWSKCQDYQGIQTLPDYIRRHSYKAQAYFVAFQDETAKSIRNTIAIRQTLQTVLDFKPVAQYLDAPGITPFLEQLSQVPNPRPWWKVIGLMGLTLMAALGAVFDAIGKAIRAGLIGLAKFTVAILGRPTRQQPISQYPQGASDPDLQQDLEIIEDRIVQNQMNVLSVVRSGRRLRLRLVLLMVNLAGRFLFPPGSLLDIRTIHFACWVMIDSDQRLLFISNYDGSWENYIGDFVDKVHSGLNAIWNNVVGYPDGGAEDIAAFRRFVRDQQAPSQVFYSAYPQETVQNLVRDRKISRGLAANFDRDATERWLSNL